MGDKLTARDIEVANESIHHYANTHEWAHKLAAVLNAKLDASGGAPQPDKGEGEPFDWRTEGYVCQSLHRVPISGCTDCDKAVAPSNFKAWFSSVEREVETDPQMSEYKMAEMAWNAGERASFEQERNPEWFREDEGSTDFSIADRALRSALAAAALTQQQPSGQAGPSTGQIPQVVIKSASAKEHTK
jgi:hypothetical protein